MDRYDDDRYALEELRHFEWADECQWFSGDADHCYPFGGVDYDNRFITHPHSQIEAKKALRAAVSPAPTPANRGRMEAGCQYPVSEGRSPD